MLWCLCLKLHVRKSVLWNLVTSWSHMIALEIYSGLKTNGIRATQVYEWSTNELVTHIKACQHQALANAPWCIVMHLEMTLQWCIITYIINSEGMSYNIGLVTGQCVNQNGLTFIPIHILKFKATFSANQL